MFLHINLILLACLQFLCANSWAWNSKINPALVSKYQTAEYNQQLSGSQHAFDDIGLARAYALLEQNFKPVGGDGVVIGISDSGVDFRIRDFRKKNFLTKSINPYKDRASRESNGAIIFDPDDGVTTGIENEKGKFDLTGHGTYVASIAAAAKDENNMHGIAFNAKLLSDKVSGGHAKYCYIYNTFTPKPYDCKFVRKFKKIDGTEVNITAGQLNGIDPLIHRGAQIINISIGVGRITKSDVKNRTDSYKYFYNTYGPEIENAAKKNVLLVIAVGNDESTASGGGRDGHSVSAFALLGTDKKLAGGSVIAVSGYSEKQPSGSYCGDAKDYCLVAPTYPKGLEIEYLDPIESNLTPNVKVLSGGGTSSSAPMVAGAAAILKAAWPYLSASQITHILLTTATDLGRPGVDEIYGHGLLNVEAAVVALGERKINF